MRTLEFLQLPSKLLLVGTDLSLLLGLEFAAGSLTKHTLLRPTPATPSSWAAGRSVIEEAIFLKSVVEFFGYPVETTPTDH